MSIAYPRGARRALAKLYRPYNPITVFVEDRNISNAYTNIINLALHGIGTIHTVIPLGDRTQVLTAAKDDQDPKNFYIVDGDLDLVFRHVRSPKSNTYILRCYCIENLILFGANVPDIMRDYNLTEDTAALTLKLNLAEWEQQAGRLLGRLFILYAIAHFKNIGIPTVAYSVMRLVLNQKPYSLDATKLRARYREVLKQVYAAIGRSRLLAERQRIVADLNKRSLSWKQIVSGKDYLLPLLHKRCEVLCGFKGPQLALLARLSRETDFSVDPNFKRVLRRYAKGTIHIPQIPYDGLIKRSKRSPD